MTTDTKTQPADATTADVVKPDLPGRCHSCQGPQEEPGAAEGSSLSEISEETEK